MSDLPEVGDLVARALAEDIGGSDWTTAWTVPADATGTARIIAKQPGIIAGADVVVRVFHHVDPTLDVRVVVRDGEPVQPSQEVLRVAGSLRSILTGERVALNFLQRLSGVATTTRRFVDAVAGTGVRILDTRKTTPGIRVLEKAAVRAGGGANHRFGLFDMVLIKENHIRAAGGITAALRAVSRANRGLPVEVEVTDLEETSEALAAGADHILFDNMDPELLRQALNIVRASGRSVATEASGGVSLSTVRTIAETGVDAISVGALTHSPPALDLSLLLDTSP
jgi:nicotinate-nucleotide pyrophosphorylase (carboxylating)